MVDFGGAWGALWAAFLVFFEGPKMKPKMRGFLRGFFGTPGKCGGLASPCLRPFRPLGMALGHGNGKQAEDLARPGPEGGRIEDADARPPHPRNGFLRLGCSVFVLYFALISPAFAEAMAEQPARKIYHKAFQKQAKFQRKSFKIHEKILPKSVPNH